MKKMMLLLASLVALTACSQSKQDTERVNFQSNDEGNKVSESSKIKKKKV